MYLIAQASADLAEVNANVFWETSLGGVLKVLLAAAAILLIIGGVFKSAGKFTSGKLGEGAKIIVGVVIAAVFLFRPELLTGIINLAGSLMEQLFSSGEELIDEGVN